MYRRFWKRCFDFLISLTALLVLSPLLLLLTLLVVIKMKGNPFFTQLRPGKDGKLFRLVKFRSMTNRRDEHGNLLPDRQRLTRFGKALRASSLDELPELFNILKGDMALVGPRPLLAEYLPRYNRVQARRHEVRPGFTGLAQIHGRNAISWEEKFEWDVRYVDQLSLGLDCRILLKTVAIVLKREGIHADGEATMPEFTGTENQICE